MSLRLFGILGLFFLTGCASLFKGDEERPQCKLLAMENVEHEGLPKGGSRYLWRSSAKPARGHSLRQFFLERTPAGTPLYFARESGALDQAGYDVSSTWPVIYTVGKKGWTEIGLRKDFEGWEWAHVAQDYERGRIWALLESAVEGGAHALPLLFSSDGGKTWILQSYVNKPQYTAQFRSFKANLDGTALISFAIPLESCANSKELPVGSEAIFVTRTSGTTGKWELGSDAEFIVALERPAMSDWECILTFETGKTLPSRCAVR